MAYIVICSLLYETVESSSSRLAMIYLSIMNLVCRWKYLQTNQITYSRQTLRCARIQQGQAITNNAIPRVQTLSVYNKNNSSKDTQQNRDTLTARRSPVVAAANSITQSGQNWAHDMHTEHTHWHTLSYVRNCCCTMSCTSNSSSQKQTSLRMVSLIHIPETRLCV